jgi:hypothetical protein
MPIRLENLTLSAVIMHIYFLTLLSNTLKTTKTPRTTPNNNAYLRQNSVARHACG